MLFGCCRKRQSNGWASRALFDALLRLFDGASRFNEWYGAEPDLTKLLQCFDVKRGAVAGSPQAFSGWATNSKSLRRQRASFRRTRSSADKRFGILLSEEECRGVGIRVDATNGGTGIKHVDLRHVDLSGDISQFTRLVALLVKKMWEGEQRLRVFQKNKLWAKSRYFPNCLTKELVPSRGKLALPSWRNQRATRSIARAHRWKSSGKFKDDSASEILASRWIAHPTDDVPDVRQRSWLFGLGRFFQDGLASGPSRLELCVSDLVCACGEQSAA